MSIWLTISVFTLLYVAYALCKTVLFLLFPSKQAFWPSWEIDLEIRKREYAERRDQMIDNILDQHPELINDNESFKSIARIKGL